jgi:hypothetical protein
MCTVSKALIVSPPILCVPVLIHRAIDVRFATTDMPMESHLRPSRSGALGTPEGSKTSTTLT